MCDIVRGGGDFDKLDVLDSLEDLAITVGSLFTMFMPGKAISLALRALTKPFRMAFNAVRGTATAASAAGVTASTLPLIGERCDPATTTTVSVLSVPGQKLICSPDNVEACRGYTPQQCKQVPTGVLHHVHGARFHRTGINGPLVEKTDRRQSRNTIKIRL